MIDFTKPVQTRDGRKVRILCTDGPAGRPIVGIREDSHVMCWASNGNHCGDSPPACKDDLINVPVKHKRWVNVYNGCRSCHLSDSQEDANSIALTLDRRIACIEIEFTEGQGL